MKLRIAKSSARPGAPETISDGVDHAGGESFVAAGEDYGRVERQRDGDFAQEQDTEDVTGQVDVEVAQQRHDREGYECPMPQWICGSP